MRNDSENSVTSAIPTQHSPNMELRGSCSTPRPIVLAGDGAYAMPLATALRSIVEANRSARPLEFHVLADGFTEAARQKVVHSLPDGAAVVQWHQVDCSALEELSISGTANKMTYARLQIPRILGPKTSRVVYLDADIVVMDDLSPLWEMDLGGAVLGAVLDDGVDLLLKEGKLAERRIPRVQPYFNAGVLVIDLPRWRKERISERAQAYLNENPTTLFWDQDGLNVACEGRWKRLEPRWNFQRHLHEAIVDIEQRRRPIIVHFATSEKPWNPTSLNINGHFYDSFRSRTHFARRPPQKVRDFFIAAWTKLKRHLERRIVGPTRWSHLRTFARRVYKTAKC